MSDKKKGDGAYNRRRPFKRLSELDKVRIENETTRHLNKEFNDNSKKLQKDINKAETTYRKKAKQIKTTEQTTNRSIKNSRQCNS